VQNFFRFYLAKPVSPLWFYGEHVVLAGLTLLAASAGFVALFSLTVHPIWSFGLVQRALVLWLLIGMPIVVCSTLSRHDWLWGIVPWLLSATLRGRWPKDQSTIGDVLHAVLPPYHLAGSESVITTAGWLWIVGWALGFFALTLLLLARRPLAEDSVAVGSVAELQERRVLQLCNSATLPTIILSCSTPCFVLGPSPSSVRRARTTPSAGRSSTTWCASGFTGRSTRSTLTPTASTPSRPIRPSARFPATSTSR
jgi:hypothetical protein